MKIILSRKGFDSSTGGVASPILPDGTMLSLPIPDPAARHRLGDITRHGMALGPLVSALTRGRLGPDTAVHLDPDLVSADRPRQPEWRGAFGQLGAAQSHLAAEGVGPGDLFLFFGWFRATERVGAGWRYQRDAPDVHALFGWLQVGEILRVGPAIDEHRRRRPWLADHPHLNGHAVPGNTVYVAARALQIAGRSLGVPGAGVFSRYDAGLRLSAPGCTRSVWTLPAWMLPARGPRLELSSRPQPLVGGQPGPGWTSDRRSRPGVRARLRRRPSRPSTLAHGDAAWFVRHLDQPRRDGRARFGQSAAAGLGRGRTGRESPADLTRSALLAKAALAVMDAGAARPAWGLGARHKRRAPAQTADAASGQRRMISTRRFCGSRTPGPVWTSKRLNPKPWAVIAARGTPCRTSSAATASARRTDRTWL